MTTDNVWIEDKEYHHSPDHIRFYNKKSGEGHVFAKTLLNQIRREAVEEGEKTGRHLERLEQMEKAIKRAKTLGEK